MSSYRTANGRDSRRPQEAPSTKQGIHTDSRAWRGTSSTSPTAYQSYGQPVTSDAYREARNVAVVSVPRSQGRSNKYYHQSTTPGYSKRGEPLSDRDNAYSLVHTDRRDRELRGGDLDRNRSYDDGYERSFAPPRRRHAQEDDSGSDVKGSYGARHRGKDQDLPRHRDSERRQDSDVVQQARRPSDPKRYSAKALPKPHDEANISRTHDAERQAKRSSVDLPSRRSEEDVMGDDRRQRRSSGRANHEHPRPDQQHSKSTYYGERQEDHDSGRDISGTYGARRNSSPPPNRHTAAHTAKRTYELSRQSTSQAHAVITSGQASQTFQRHKYNHESRTPQNASGRHNQADMRDRSNSQVEQRKRDNLPDDKPRIVTQRMREGRRDGSDSDADDPIQSTRSKHSSRVTVGRHASTGNDSVSDALKAPFRALRLTRAPSRDDDDDDSDDVRGSYGYRTKATKGSRHSSSKNPRPKPDDDDDDDIRGAYGSRHV